MGDPKRSKKKYDKPNHPWKAERLEDEKKIRREFGLGNKKEIWRAETTLRGYRRQARRLLALRTEQADVEEKQLIEKLKRYNLLGEDPSLDDILSLDIKDILSRRLQTIVYKKGLANTPKQAWQFIVHGHITVGNNKVTSPGYMVTKNEESAISHTPETTVSSLVEGKVGEKKAEEAS